jgi:hypothetical protein
MRTQARSAEICFASSRDFDMERASSTLLQFA